MIDNDLMLKRLRMIRDSEIKTLNEDIKELEGLNRNLLEACELAIDLLTCDNHEQSGIISFIGEAIAKAKGETNATASN